MVKATGGAMREARTNSESRRSAASVMRESAQAPGTPTNMASAVETGLSTALLARERGKLPSQSARLLASVGVNRRRGGQAKMS